jgi:hypothetical protein
MKFSILLFAFALTLVFSCNSHNLSLPTNGNQDVKNNSAIGDTFSELGKAVMVIFQDRKNNYWFAGRGQGVYRFDGKIILNFKTKDGLVNNDIWGIQEDKSGNIYFDTQEGVSKFDGQTFFTIQVSDSSDDWTGVDTDDMWFKGNWNKNGVYRYDGKTLHQLTFPKNDIAEKLYATIPNMTWSPYGLYSIFKDRKGNMWFGTSNAGIYRYNINSKANAPAWMYEDELTYVSGGGSFGIRSMFEDKEGNFWFCNTNYRYQIEDADSSTNKNKLIRYKKINGIENVAGLKGFYFMSITDDQKGKLWMVTYSEGVYSYDGKNLIHYPVKDGDRDITLYTIYKDNQGTLWLGTHETGAYKFNGESFEKFKP